jgi:hypothetical protein
MLCTVDTIDFINGQDFGFDFPHGTLAQAVMHAEDLARIFGDVDVGEFMRGRNAGVAAWHENEREMAAEAAGRE